jgi:hypothetical protein
MSAEQRVEFCSDNAAASWIRPRLMSFGSGVGAIVPPVFETYARLLHPARAEDGSPVPLTRRTWAARRDSSANYWPMSAWRPGRFRHRIRSTLAAI